MTVDLVPQLARAIDARARRILAPEGKTRAAVLVPMLSIDDAIHLLYTRRAASLPHHQGQISFPGGTHDPARDADAVATALREAHEEIGLLPGDVRVLGTLDDIETMTTRFVITPVVGIVPHPYAWAPCPRDVRVSSPQMPEPVVVAHEEYPKTSWYGSGVHEVELTPLLDAVKGHIPEGPATLEIWASDHSWFRMIRRRPLVSQPITVDVTPPTLEVLSKQHVARLGGSECLIYKVGADATSSGVQVGELFFPGTTGLFADPALRVALFALPESQPNAVVSAVAVDAAGNPRAASFDLVVPPRSF